MLFPIQQKDLYLHPWFALFTDFKYGLMHTEKWYVVGYAFNDDFIRNVFVEQLKQKTKPALVIINTSVKDIILKFPSELREKIVLLPIKFGSKYFPSQINDFLNGVRTLTVKVKTMHNNEIGFKSSLPFVQATFTKISGDVRNQKLSLHSQKEWIQVFGYSSGPDEEELEFEFKLEHKPPFDKDFELQIEFLSEKDYELSVYMQDLLLDMKKGRTKHDSEVGKYMSDVLKINSDFLFISS